MPNSTATIWLGMAASAATLSVLGLSTAPVIRTWPGGVDAAGAADAAGAGAIDGADPAHPASSTTPNAASATAALGPARMRGV
ncbi:MAG TPA: hypothetical protein VGM60_12655 [Pseudonocardia sp.]|uniref:hypothetical protein n=1 Tax=Pseudonocardia sp. TaxID=60912 RepID=UPI002F422DBE